MAFEEFIRSFAASLGQGSLAAVGVAVLAGLLASAI